MTALIAADRSDVGTTLSQLQQIMSQVTTFIDNNKASLGATLTNLANATPRPLSSQMRIGGLGASVAA